MIDVAYRLNQVASLAEQIKGANGVYIIYNNDHGKDIYEIRYVPPTVPNLIISGSRMRLLNLPSQHDKCVVCSRKSLIPLKSACADCYPFMCQVINGGAMGGFFSFDRCLTRYPDLEDTTAFTFVNIITNSFRVWYHREALLKIGIKNDTCGFIEQVSKIRRDIMEGFECADQVRLWRLLLCWQDWRKYMPIFAHGMIDDIKFAIMDLAIQVAINDVLV